MKKVLIIDDSEDFTFLLETILKKKYEVITAASCSEAKEKFIKFNPELLISDIGLDDGDGLDLLEQLSKINKNVLTFISSGRFTQFKHKSLDVFVKPYSPVELLNKIEAHIFNYNNSLSQNKEVYYNKEIKLVYLSEAKESLSAKDLHQLVVKAQKKNKEANITGCLFYDGTYFFQYLEGPYPNVISLLSSLKKDKRHQILELTSVSAENKRIFPDWDMKMVEPSEDLQSHINFINKVRNHLQISSEYEGEYEKVVNHIHNKLKTG